MPYIHEISDEEDHRGANREHPKHETSSASSHKTHYRRHHHNSYKHRSKESRDTFSDYTGPPRGNKPPPKVPTKFRKTGDLPNRDKHRDISVTSVQQDNCTRASRTIANSSSLFPSKKPKLNPDIAKTGGASVECVDNTVTVDVHKGSKPSASISPLTKSRSNASHTYPRSSLIVSTTSLVVPSLTPSRSIQSRPNSSSAAIRESTSTLVNQTPLSLPILALSVAPTPEFIGFSPVNDTGKPILYSSEEPESEYLELLPVGVTDNVSAMPDGIDETENIPASVSSTPSLEQQLMDRLGQGSFQTIDTQDHILDSQSANQSADPRNLIAAHYQNGLIRWNIEHGVTRGSQFTEINLQHMRNLLDRDFDVFQFMAFLQQVEPQSEPALGTVRVNATVNIDDPLNTFLTNTRLWDLMLPMQNQNN